MKTLKKIKLNEFSKNELDQRQLNTLKGGSGGTCTCIVILDSTGAYTNRSNVRDS